MDRNLLRAGLLLILLGLFGGILIPTMARPRLGLSAHLVAVEGGLLIGLVAVSWSLFRLTELQGKLAKGLIIYANYANWIGTLLGAYWRATRLMPIAGGEPAADGPQEALVAFLLYSLSAAALAGVGLLLYGLRGSDPEQV
ncbi:MAG: hydrogenase [Vulcanimicrobiota bacterium]